MNWLRNKFDLPDIPTRLEINSFFELWGVTQRDCICFARHAQGENHAVTADMTGLTRYGVMVVVNRVGLDFAKYMHDQRKQYREPYDPAFWDDHWLEAFSHLELRSISKRTRQEMAFYETDSKLTIKSLVKLSKKDILRDTSLGHDTIRSIQKILDQHGLELGMSPDNIQDQIILDYS